ncbi:MAG: undecaprenyldiphospho-muramoylpentapeptide beta-N-acetylglucosaminyltransferase [bacterium]|nr:undecaprenyldiphospho-muramoylpentapeptide beta-N-acetylglucosaminyltransferase [bacterium]
MRILLTGGGTGGHVMPLLAIAESLRARSDKAVLLWLGQGNPEESSACENQIPFCKIACAKFRRYFSFWNFTDIFKMPIGIFQSFFLILGFRPDAVFSKGGYVSLPVILAAFILRKKIIVHESDVITGLSNRIVARFAKKVLLGFPTLLVENGKYVFTGNPVRSEISRGDRKRAFQFFHLQKNKPVILAMGGSQGSRFINNLIVKALPKLEEYQIIHLTGVSVIARSPSLSSKSEGRRGNLLSKEKYYHPYSYLDVTKMALAYSVCDLVISRAGANSLAEIAVCNKSSILIPLPASASGHQMANAKVFEKTGASLILEQKDLDAEKFAQEVKKLLTDLGRLAKMASQAKSLAKLDAAEKIAGEILGK